MYGYLPNTTNRYCLCIGAAKAGTTWLYEQLKHAPEMYFLPEKEIHYFYSRYGAFNRLPSRGRFSALLAFIDRAKYNFDTILPEPEFARRYAFFQKNLDWYQSFAQGPITGSWYRRLFTDVGPNQYGCDFSPSTCKINRAGVQSIRDLSENVKLIYILRNPMDRLWSHIKFHAEFLCTFEEVKQYSPSELVSFARKESLIEDGNYGTYLRNFLKVFDRNEILVLDFDDIRADPAGLSKRVCDFLEIAPVQLPETASSAVNASQHIDKPEGLLDGFKSGMLKEVKILESLGYDFASKWRDSL